MFTPKDEWPISESLLAIGSLPVENLQKKRDLIGIAGGQQKFNNFTKCAPKIVSLLFFFFRKTTNKN